MWKVDIYLETDSKVQKNMDRRCGYVLETICAGAIRTVEGFSRISGTYHSANLQNLAAALSRITKTSRVCVHTEDGRNGLEGFKRWPDQKCRFMEEHLGAGRKTPTGNNRKH